MIRLFILILLSQALVSEAEDAGRHITPSAAHPNNTPAAVKPPARNVRSASVGTPGLSKIVPHDKGPTKPLENIAVLAKEVNSLGVTSAHLAGASENIAQIIAAILIGQAIKQRISAMVTANQNNFGTFNDISDFGSFGKNYLNSINEIGGYGTNTFGGLGGLGGFVPTVGGFGTANTLVGVGGTGFGHVDSLGGLGGVGSTGIGNAHGLGGLGGVNGVVGNVGSLAGNVGIHAGGPNGILPGRGNIKHSVTANAAHNIVGTAKTHEVGGSTYNGCGACAKCNLRKQAGNIGNIGNTVNISPLGAGGNNLLTSTVPETLTAASGFNPGLGQTTNIWQKLQPASSGWNPVTGISSCPLRGTVGHVPSTCPTCMAANNLNLGLNSGLAETQLHPTFNQIYRHLYQYYVNPQPYMSSYYQNVPGSSITTFLPYSQEQIQDNSPFERKKIITLVKKIMRSPAFLTRYRKYLENRQKSSKYSDSYSKAKKYVYEDAGEPKDAVEYEKIPYETRTELVDANEFTQTY